MKISLDKKRFLNNLKLLSKVLKVDARKSPVHIFEINVQDNLLIFRVSNTLAELIIKQPVLKITNPIKEKVLVPIDNLMEYLQFLTEEEVCLEVKDAMILISQGKSHAQIGLIRNKELNEIKQPKLEPVLVFDDNIVVKVNKVALSVSGDDSRPILTSIMLESFEDKLRMVGTDGYRLSVFDFDVPYIQSQQILIPAKLFNLVLRSWPTKGMQLSLDLSAQRVIFYGDNYQIGLRIIAGDYPPYQRIIADNHLTKIDVDRQQFLSAVDQLAVFSRQAANTIILDIKGKEILLKTKNDSLGQGEATVAAAVDGEELQIGFNFRYLQEFLKLSKDDSISFKFNGSLAPATIENEQDKFKYVIMPVKLD